MFAFKKFFRNSSGALTTLFVDNAKELPVNKWINATEPFHFTASNGREYVPTRKQSNGGKATGSSIKIPSAEIKAQLVKLGFCTAKAKSVKCVAYRPGWHTGALPYFPQGGIKSKSAPYGMMNERNSVYCIVEIQGSDYTSKARSQAKCFSKAGKFMPKRADLQYMPKDGFYFYSTNPKNLDNDAWIISDRIRIVRELSRSEVSNIMENNNMQPQIWAE